MSAAFCQSIPPSFHSTHGPLLSSLQIPEHSKCLSTPAIIFVTPPKITWSIRKDPDKISHLIAACAKAGVSAIQLRDPLCKTNQDFLNTQALIEGTVMNVTPRTARPIVLMNGGPNPTHFPERLIKELARRRRNLGNSKVLGCSVHSVNAAKRALKAGASFLQVGTIFSTASHPGKRPEGLKLMREIKDEIGEEAMLIGIGGITAANARNVMTAGASGVAVISAVSDAKDPQRAVEELWKAVRAT